MDCVNSEKFRAYQVCFLECANCRPEIAAYETIPSFFFLFQCQQFSEDLRKSVDGVTLARAEDLYNTLRQELPPGFNPAHLYYFSFVCFEPPCTRVLFCHCCVLFVRLFRIAAVVSNAADLVRFLRDSDDYYATIDQLSRNGSSDVSCRVVTLPSLRFLDLPLLNV